VSKLQATLAELSNQFAQAVTRALMASVAEGVADLGSAPHVTSSAKLAPSRAVPATATKGKAAPKKAAPKMTAPKKAAPTVAVAPPALTQGKRGPAPKAAPASAEPVLRASLASPSTQTLLAAIVKVLAKGPLYSEDLRREVNIDRRALAKPLALGLKTRQIAKSGDRRKTVYQLA
jgi:hypothetical protein